jgi:hypothetical protein
MKGPRNAIVGLTYRSSFVVIFDDYRDTWPADPGMGPRLLYELAYACRLYA